MAISQQLFADENSLPVADRSQHQEEHPVSKQTFSIKAANSDVETTPVHSEKPLQSSTSKSRIQHALQGKTAQPSWESKQHVIISSFSKNICASHLEGQNISFAQPVVRFQLYRLCLHQALAINAIAHLRASSVLVCIRICRNQASETANTLPVFLADVSLLQEAH